MKKIVLLMLVACCFSSCEKDDICADETTPLLVIKFFDKNNNALPKNVISLEVKAQNAPLPLGNTTFGSNEIKIPLDDAADTTVYNFKLNSTSATLANTDVLTFNYSRQEIYVSRACGFKTTYLLTNTNNDLITSTDVNWISSYSIENNAINTQNETHINIYF